MSMFGAGRWGLGAALSGFDRRMPAPPQAYEEYFKAYSMNHFSARQRNDVSYGGKTDLELESPWTFTLRSTGRGEHKHTHGGVVEFIAEEGIVYLPVWMMRMLTLQDGDPIHIQGTRLPKGKFVKLQPQTVDFLEISDPKAVLEQALRNYPTLTPGDIIEISYNCLTFEILIMEIEPSAEGISIIETDLEVDFAPPKGYVEPAPKPAAPQPTMASKMHIDQNKYDSVLPGGDSATPFRGFGQTLSGKKTKGKKEKPIVPREPSSLVRSTDNDTLLEEKRVPAALHLPFGQLFFGYNVERLDVPVDTAPEQPEDDPAPPPDRPAFAGGGQMLLGTSRPTPEVIEIDDD